MTPATLRRLDSKDGSVQCEVVLNISQTDERVVHRTPHYLLVSSARNAALEWMARNGYEEVRKQQ